MTKGDIGGVWRTVGGRRIFIKDGQDLTTAMKESGKFKSNSYNDITNKWLKEVTSDKYKVKELDHFEYKGTKYMVDGKNVVLDYSKKEKDIAEWLKNTLGVEIFMVPRVNKPDGISTPDFLFKDEYWDLKEISGNNKRTIDNAIKKKQNQAHNFIIDISKSNLNDNEATQQLEHIYYDKNRKWVDKMLLKNNEHLIIILERKKKRLTISPK